MYSYLQLILSIVSILFNTATLTSPKNTGTLNAIVTYDKTHAKSTPIFLNKLHSNLNLDPIVISDSASFMIPFSRAGNLIIIKAKVDTTEGSFILDTGAPYLILNMTYFRDYEATGESEDGQGGITGQAMATAPTKVSTLSFGPVKYYKLHADRINLGHIENSKGIKILGLLGLQLFKEFEMIIDYQKSVLFLHWIKKNEKSIPYHHPMLKDTSGYTTTPITIKEDKLLTYGFMGGKKLTFVIDTGAESNVMDSRLPNKIFENINITRRVILTGTGNKKLEALYGDMKNMKIGNRDMASLPVLVTNLEKLCFAANQCIDGMLGFDFLSLQKIGFNFVSRKMYIWK